MELEDYTRQLRTAERLVLNAAEAYYHNPTQMTSDANLKHAVAEMLRARRERIAHLMLLDQGPGLRHMSHPAPS